MHCIFILNKTLTAELVKFATKKITKTTFILVFLQEHFQKGCKHLMKLLTQLQKQNPNWDMFSTCLTSYQKALSRFAMQKQCSHGGFPHYLHNELFQRKYKKGELRTYSFEKKPYNCQVFYFQPQTFRAKQNFIPVNSPKLCCTPWKYQD